MIAIISPAKNMRNLKIDNINPQIIGKERYFTKETEEIIRALKDLTPWDIQSLMKVNEKITLQSYAYFQDFNFNDKGVCGLLAYDGLVFKNIKADGDTFKASYNDSIKMYTKKFEIENKNINEKGTLDITNIKTTIGTNSNCQTTIDDYKIISMHNGNSVSIGEGIIEATGHVKCSYIETTSARDKKTEIVPTTHTNAVEEINKINIVDFYFKNDTERKNKKIGFIAEDTDITFSVDNKHFDVNNCIGMLLKSVQELSSENKILREKIEKLESR